MGIIKSYMYKKVIAVKYILCYSPGIVMCNSCIGVHRSFAFSHVTEVKCILNAKVMLNAVFSIENYFWHAADLEYIGV